jgi:DNA processing protein
MNSPEIRSWRNLDPSEQDQWRLSLQARGLHVLTLDDLRYPPLLRQIADPPPVLFVQGNPEVLSLPQIAIVGSRHPTIDGCDNARIFAEQLGEAGYVVTSGMALGIDTEAHRGALARDGITIAVLGCGLDCIGSRAYRAFANRIAKRGAVVSEFLPNMSATTFNFPQRNRIISGLAHGVLVVEAAEQSGSLITARCAGEQGREVFAVPGSIRNPMAHGCHRLIRQGVKLAQRVEDILEEFPALVQWERERAETGARPVLTKRQKALLEHIAYDPVSIDALLQRSRRDLPDLYAELTKLEIAGYIVNRADGYVLSGPKECQNARPCSPYISTKQ